MSTLVAQTISNGTVSTSSANVIQGSAKAWVNFSSAASILASYNVSSVTNNSTGVYTIAFTNALSDTNYCVSQGHGWNGVREWGINSTSTTSLQIVTGFTNNTSGGGTGANAVGNIQIIVHR